jgi:hypothetical protein
VPRDNLPPIGGLPPVRIVVGRLGADRFDLDEKRLPIGLGNYEVELRDGHDDELVCDGCRRKCGVHQELICIGEFVHALDDAGHLAAAVLAARADGLVEMREQMSAAGHAVGCVQNQGAVERFSSPDVIFDFAYHWQPFDR